jgi:hypothetical protein
MAARRGRVAVSITADNSGLKRGVKDSERDLGRLQRVGVSSTRGLSAGFKAAGGLIAGAAVADQIRQTVVAAQESEVSAKKMQAQLKALGISYRAHAKEIDNVIQKTSQLSGLDDEDLQDSFTSIVRATGNVQKALKGTAIAADLARAKHMDVAKAGDLVAKVYNGNVGALKRMGIALNPVTTAQDKLKESTKHATVEQQRAAKEADKTATAQKALAALQKRVGGQAEAYGKTSAGAADRFKVAIENLRENVGAKLLPVLTKLTNKAADFVNQMTNGTGAGGRFAAKLKEIADRAKPIVKFFTDHPKLIALAIGAWAAYRAAAALAMAATRLKALGMFKGLARPAAVEGTKAGAAFGEAASTSGGAAMRAGKWSSVGSSIGGAMGTAAGIAMVGELAVQIAQWLKKQPWYKPPGGKGGFLDDLIPDSFFPKKKPGQKMGGLLGALGVGQGGGSSGPNHSKQSPFHPSTPLGKLPKAKTSSVRAHTSSVRATAAVASVGNTRTARRVTAHAASGGLYTAPELAALWIKAGGNPAHADMAAAVALAESSGDPNAGQTHPYHGLWQIGPGGPWDPLANAKEAVRKSFNGTNWNAWTTVTGYDTPGHVPTYTQFLGRSGYSTSSTGGATAPITLPGSKKARPKIPTVGLERGQSGVSKGLGSSVLKGGGTWGRKPHKVTTSFSAALTSGQVADLAADPATNPKARQMRLFAVASRINQITSALTSGRVKSQATKDRLLDELKGLYGERDDLLKPIAGPDPLTGTAAIPGADAYLSSLDRQAAEAALTPDTADDKSVAGLQLKAAQNIYDYEKSHGFSDADIADAARNLKTARDNVDQADQATTALTDQMKALTDELKRQNDINEHIIGVSSGQWQKAFADVLNGQIGGFIDSRARTAGDGSLARA